MNHYKIFILFLALTAYWSLSAQTLKPWVLASSGQHVEAANLQLSYTIGEAVVSTKTQGSLTLTQGFHQSYKTAVGIPLLAQNLNIHVYPNPSIEYINVFIETDKTQDYKLQLYSITGQLLLQNNLTSNQNKIISTQGLAAGIYIMHLVDTNENPMGIYRIEKIN